MDNKKPPSTSTKHNKNVSNGIGKDEKHGKIDVVLNTDDEASVESTVSISTTTDASRESYNNNTHINASSEANNNDNDTEPSVCSPHGNNEMEISLSYPLTPILHQTNANREGLIWLKTMALIAIFAGAAPTNKKQNILDFIGDDHRLNN